MERIRLQRFLNTCAVSVLIRYEAGKMDKGRTENIAFYDQNGVDKNGAFYSKRDVDRLYVSREDGGRGLISCEGYVRGEEQFGVICEEFFGRFTARGNSYW